MNPKWWGEDAITREEDAQWRADQQRNGWKLPRLSKPGWLRWWGIRHVRAFRRSMAVEKHAEMWAEVGLGWGRPNPYDEWVIYAIYRGWA